MISDNNIYKTFSYAILKVCVLHLSHQHKIGNGRWSRADGNCNEFLTVAQIWTSHNSNRVTTVGVYNLHCAY
jgi:hypothetical protein